MHVLGVQLAVQLSVAAEHELCIAKILAASHELQSVTHSSGVHPQHNLGCLCQLLWCMHCTHPGTWQLQAPCFRLPGWQGSGRAGPPWGPVGRVSWSVSVSWGGNCEACTSGPACLTSPWPCTHAVHSHLCGGFSNCLQSPWAKKACFQCS
jgi:hypothetical protein